MERSQQGMPLKIIKKKFSDFRKFYHTTLLVNLHHFSYFDPTKKSAKFFKIIFSGILTFHAPHCFRECAQRNNRNLGFEQRSLEQWTKSKIVKVKSFYNNLTHHMPRLTYFFLGHPNVHGTALRNHILIVFGEMSSWKKMCVGLLL